MKHLRGIDNQEPIFQFDADEIRHPFDASKTSRPTSPSSCMTPSSTSTPSAQPSDQSTSHLFMQELRQPERGDQEGSRCSESRGSDKGKGLVEPMPIPASGSSAHDAHYSSLLSTSLLLESQLSTPPNDFSGQFDGSFSDGAPASLTDKGKARELPPTLPPLSFSSPDFGYSTVDWPSPGQSSPTPGPSSYGSGYTSLRTASSSHSQPSSIEVAGATEPDPHNLSRVPSRRKSLSNLSIHSTRSLTAQSMSRIKVKLGSSSKSPVTLARKLLTRNKADAVDPSVSGAIGDSRDLLIDDLVPLGPGSCYIPWQTKDYSPSPTFWAENEAVAAITPEKSAVWHLDNYRPGGVMSLKGKGRSYSSPLPQSAFDFLPQDGLEGAFAPLFQNRNLFDEMLPRELRLQVFSTLTLLHEADDERLKSSGKWSVLKAASPKNRWIGRDHAMRELVRLSRVSKSWRALVFDGQLWQDVDLRAFPKLPTSFLLRLAESLGPFIKNIDLSGHTHLSPTALIDVTSSLCVRSAPTMSFTHTQLAAINLQGCTTVTMQSLHSLLIRSPFLRSLNVKGLQAVTNATFDVLALCSQLTSLNMSRCANINGEGVRAFGAAVMARGARLALKELRLSGLPDIHDAVLATLGKAAPLLEVLDLSYCRSLHNSALEALVSCTEYEKDDFETIALTARDAGRDPRDSRRYWRRVTALRHLSLSNCILITDIACSNLAYSVPRLEFLELAGIGTELKDDGLVRLLATTPFIRRLDLEDASDITDAVLEAITPSPQIDVSSNSGSISTSTESPQPGHALEHLTVSYAINISNDTFIALIRGCPKLRVLEADSTCMSGAVLREFVRLVRERGIDDAGLVAVDCRSVGESVVKEVASSTRPRKGWRSWDARKLGYLDGRDGEDLKVGQDECDEKRVVLKSFYNWQTVDAVRAAREKRKANRKARDGSSEQASEAEDAGRMSGRMRWWTPSSRRSSGNNTPGEDGVTGDRDGCIVM
ncbi:hypothetical protein HYDPIDRAFT_186775 [Hydnomerulius pinastri MD-312]|nr:hypothetical protein HYDPIDRAFT_186775 [Hydnomerulius pinastri MD-312]